MSDFTAALEEEEGVERLTFGGQLAIDHVRPYAEGEVDSRTIGGANVRVALPAGWVVQSVTAAMGFEGPAQVPGFQRAPRGTALLNLLPGTSDVHPEAIVNMRDGLLAQFSLDWGPEASTAFSLWQGPWTELYTTGFETFDQALEAFDALAPNDGPDGATLAIPAAARLQRDEVTIDCVDHLIGVRQRDKANVPPWEGFRGAHVDLYRLEAEHGEAVLATSISAAAVITRTDGAPVSDADLSDLARALAIEGF